jgi:peptide-methionine (S)-S-oxide reductase
MQFRKLNIGLLLFVVLNINNIHAKPESMPIDNETAVATFAGGCFWCMEPPFDKLEGVLSTVSGYSGGKTKNPDYKQVSTGRTGHAEVLQVKFDPEVISFTTLLEVFWLNVDPTRVDGQFCDSGNQYRPEIFYHNDEQKKAAEESKSNLISKKPFPESIKVEITKAQHFYAAEDYHQDYYLKNPIRYKYYRHSCGRDKKLKTLWGEKFKK